MKFDKGLMAGSGTMLVLALLEESDMYGYQIIEELAHRSKDVFDGCVLITLITSFVSSLVGKQKSRSFPIVVRKLRPSIHGLCL